MEESAPFFVQATLSSQIITPSSEAPNDDHLRKIKLSYLDQLVPQRLYVPLIFFYQADESTGLNCSNHSQISLRLKQSLSRALSSFYPLAGQLDDDNLTVNCNDSGVLFIESRAHARLTDVIQSSGIHHLRQCVALDDGSSDAAAATTTLMAVKVSFFDCGGIAVGICFPHRIGDFESSMAFINAWTATCRGESHHLVNYRFDLAEHFPSRDLPVPDWGSSSGENMVAKRLVFGKEILEALKQDAISTFVANPTRVELISAFIWKHFIGASSSGKRLCPAMHTVNLRKRATPPQLLENVFGNCFLLALALNETSCRATVRDEFPELVRILRNSIKKIDGEYIRDAQTGDGFLGDVHELFSRRVKGEIEEACTFSSWCGFPVYEVDYGWGVPVSFGTLQMFAQDHTIILVNTRCGQGIEAWVNLDKHVVDMLEMQIRLISSKMEEDNLDECASS